LAIATHICYTTFNSAMLQNVRKSLMNSELEFFHKVLFPMARNIWAQVTVKVISHFKALRLGS